MRLPDPPVARDLALRLGDLGYSVDGVRARLGSVAADALDRNASVPATRVLADDSEPLATMIKLFLLAESVLYEQASRALNQSASALGALLQADGNTVRATVELSPYSVDDNDWLVAADWPSSRTGRPLSEHHVLGVGAASTLLAQCTVRPEVGRALDVGTGCGVQAFHLHEHADEVVATDISQRCIAVAKFNFAMNGMAVKVRQGDLLEPAAAETFDLIVSNPPFVVGSPAAHRHDYRDSGLAGDDVCATLVDQVASRLNDGGWCQMLANWEITDGDDWSARPRSWLDDSSLDAWVVQRDVQDPAAYIENWLRDSGDHRDGEVDQIYDSWLQTLEERGVVGIGFGLVTLRAGGRSEPLRCFQHVPQVLVQPVGPDVERWFRAQDALVRLPGAEVLFGLWSRAADVEIVTEFVPGAPAPHGRSVHRRTGFSWSGPIDDFGADLLARADGSVPLGEAVTALALETGADPGEVLTAAVPVIRQLVAEGFLVDVS